MLPRATDIKSWMYYTASMPAVVAKSCLIRSRGHKTFFMLNSTEHEIRSAYKTLSDVVHVFIMLINVKMPTIVVAF